jgi:ribose 1,5-bisphosphokinase
MSTLFYVIGASGVGKDTLMNYARKAINGNASVIFAHRYITRDTEAGNENHINISREEFALRKANHLFALDWESHGQCYGIGIEIDVWLQKGLNIVVNGSRQYLPIAKSKYPDIKDILIDADPEVIKERLMQRNREDATGIQKRIERSATIKTDLSNSITIYNNTTVEEAGAILVNLVSKVG